MLGQYAALAKWVLIIGTLSAIVWAIDNNGYKRAWNKHLGLEQERMKEVEKVKQESHDLAIQETAKSQAYADFIEGEYNDKVDQIKKLKSDILDFNSSVSRMRQRSACSGNTNRMSKNSNTGIHEEATTNDDSGFSDEFKQFLKSQEERDKFQMNWAIETMKGLNELCTKKNVECR